MRIGILGAGAMAAPLTAKWIAAGHEVFVGGRSPDRAGRLAAELGPRATGGSLGEAAAFGEATLLAVRWEGIRWTLAEAGAEEGTLADKPLIDCTNPVEVERFTLTTGRRSIAEDIAELSGARVVKAFNLCQASVWALDPPLFDGRRLVVPMCGDSSSAKYIATTLISDVGCQSVDIGGLYRAGQLEAMAAVVIGLLFSGYDPLTVFNLISPGDRAAGLDV